MIRQIFICCLLFLSCYGNSHAQTFDEWFRQKKTQRKYLLQQIAALKVYADYLKKGYKIVDGGISTIKDIKSGDFGLHSSFFGSLKRINPKIRKYAKVADIAAYAAGMLQSYHKTMQDIKESGRYSAAETGELLRFYGLFLEDVEGDLEELAMIMTDGELELTDDQRINRIDRLYYRCQDKYQSLQQFNERTRSLKDFRALQREEGALLKALYGIK